MKRIILFFLLFPFVAIAQQKEIKIVFTSDVHFGLKKAHFRNAPDSVSSEEVNKAMAEKMKSIGMINYLVVTGDIANREEVPIQPASVSWKQFINVYKPIHVPLLLLPGNHDISNKIGYYRSMYPETDGGSLIGIYNEMHPDQKINSDDFQYNPQQFNYSEDIGGIHFLFINIWPDSANRVWMDKDLKKINTKIPVLIFAHDPPEGDARHFTDPSGKKINADDQFEDLLLETYNDHYEKDWDQFLKQHPNIKGYFHGHSNFQQFYLYKGVKGDLSLPCFRVDSPMKGKYSSRDERLLSFQLITIYPEKKEVVVKECFWNLGAILQWGETYTLNLNK